MRSRLHAALALLVAPALVTATGSFVGSSEHVLGTTSPSASASFAFPDDDRGYTVTVVPQLLLVGLLFALAVVALVLASPSRADVVEPRRARGPPSR